MRKTLCLILCRSFRMVDQEIMVLFIRYGSYGIVHIIFGHLVNERKRESDYGFYGAPEMFKAKRSGIDRRSADRRKLRKYLSKIQRLQGKSIKVI